MSSSDDVSLSRSLGLFSVTMIGVGAMIGAGIFVLTGIAAGTAGPALLLVFLLNGVVTLFTAMTYAELGSALPEAGGGYLWVKESMSRVQGFLSGWMSWFAHAVAGSLYALGFGAYFGEILDAMGISLFGLSGDLLVKLLAIVIAAAFIYINYKGSSEAGLAGNVVTVVKIIIIGLFILSGLLVMHKNPDWGGNFTPFLPNGWTGVLAAMGLTFIAFEGYEIIVQAGEELKNPKRNIPRAIFLSLIIVVPIYLLVAVTSIGALKVSDGTSWEYLGQHGELGIVEAARQFMPYGGFLILLGGLLSTMSALNATTFSSTRVSFAMGRDFNLPEPFKRIHPKNRTPYQALFISGALIIFVALALPIEDVASAADIMFLLLFLQVNVAVIKIRKTRGSELDYGYKMPFFPVIPVLAIIMIIVLAGVLYTYSPLAWYTTLAWIGIGAFVYYSYSHKKEHVEREKIAREENPGGYRIVVALNYREEVKPLMRIASGIAKAQKSDIVVLNVIEMPHQTFLYTGKKFIKDREPLFEAAVREGNRLGVRVHKKIIISHDPANAITEFAKKSKSDVIIMGWVGRIYKQKIRRSVPQRVLERAPCNVCVVKPRKKTGKIKSILLPIGNEPRPRAYRVNTASKIAETYNASITLLTFVPKDGLKQRKPKIKQQQDLVEKQCGIKVGKKVVASASLADAIIDESKNHDLIIIGASREWILTSVLFGTLQDKLSNEAACHVIMVKEPEVKTETWFNLAFKRILPKR